MSDIERVARAICEVVWYGSSQVAPLKNKPDAQAWEHYIPQAIAAIAAIRPQADRNEELKSLWMTGKYTASELAERVGLTTSGVFNVIRRGQWVRPAEAEAEHKIAALRRQDAGTRASPSFGKPRGPYRRKVSRGKMTYPSSGHGVDKEFDDQPMKVVVEFMHA